MADEEGALMEGLAIPNRWQRGLPTVRVLRPFSNRPESSRTSAIGEMTQNGGSGNRVQTRASP